MGRHLTAAQASNHDAAPAGDSAPTEQHNSLVRQLVRHHQRDVAAVEQRGGGRHQQGRLPIRHHACRVGACN